MLLPHSVTITTPVLVTDEYNNAVESYGTGAVVRSDVAAYVQPLVGSETLTDREAVKYAYIVFTHESVNVRDRLTWRDKTYDVNGPSRPLETPYGLHHYETDLTLVEG